MEFQIDWGIGANLVVDLLPAIELSISPPDNDGFRLSSIGFHFLIFGVVFQYYYPAIYKFNELGEVVGRNIYPECNITQIG